MKAPLELQSIIDHDAFYINNKHQREVQLKNKRDLSVIEHKDHVKNLPYTPNIKENPHDELSRYR